MTVHHTFDAKTRAGTTPGVAPKKELDLVFTMDVTGSMGSYINAAKKNIQAIARRLVQEEGYSVRFGLVAYRDHPPQDMTFVSKSFAFTPSVDKMAENLATLHAQGGGDGPEAVPFLGGGPEGDEVLLNTGGICPSVCPSRASSALRPKPSKMAQIQLKWAKSRQKWPKTR